MYEEIDKVYLVIILRKNSLLPSFFKAKISLYLYTFTNNKVIDELNKKPRKLKILIIVVTC